MSRLKNISRFLLGALAVAAAASTIGLAPAASAKCCQWSPAPARHIRERL